MTDLACYVYAVGRDLDDDDLDGLAGAGVGGGDPRLVDGTGLAAVVSDVPRAEFESRALDDRLTDLDWLAATARAHHHVVDTLGRHRTLAPVSLATVYFDDERVRELLTTNGPTFTAVLDRLHGRAEWGVKVSIRAGERDDRPAERPRSGTEYLRGRRRALRDGDRAVTRAEADAEEVDATLRSLAVDARRHRPQERALTGRPERMVLNGAYLVDAAAADALTAAVAAWDEHPRVRVELTGPWVPYSFAGLDTS